MDIFDGTVVTSSAIRLHYWHTGTPGPALVMLHGITDNGLCWRRTAQALAADYQIIMLDARGHGLSDAPEQGYASEDHAGDAAALIEALELDRPVITGHSMGAATAAVLAASRPDLVRGVVLEDPPWIEVQVPPELMEQARLDWEKDLRELQALSQEEVEARGVLRNPRWDLADLPDWAASKLQTRPRALRYVIEQRTPWQETAARLQTPGLLITADPGLGALVRPEAARRVLSLWAQGKEVRLSGAGHSIRREAFDAYLHVLKEFLQEIFGRTS